MAQLRPPNIDRIDDADALRPERHTMNLTSIAAISAALVLGFLAGLLTFKRSLQWCRICGASLACLECSQPLGAESAKQTGTRQPGNLRP
ncbi:hypothetical protein AB0I37_27720 [Micromonospora purpureochromogenes]|uniref:hypothetical protein n=1 Tax=Micromonospora purpureochromogenes TaxID=47872 RepID=UPI0033DA221F